MPTAPHFLGAQANIGRWILDEGATPTDPPRQVHASSMAVVWGVYSSPTLERLEAAEEEARIIQDLYKAASIDARAGPRLSACSVEPRRPTSSTSRSTAGTTRRAPAKASTSSSGPPIDPFQIRGSDLSSRSPFVFLNACQVGAGQNLLGNYGGIAQAFLRIGASAVVAPLWSIDDAIAQKIALGFYEHALAADDKARDAAAPDDAAEDRQRPAVADLLRKARAGAGRVADLPRLPVLRPPLTPPVMESAAAAGGPSNG